MYNINIDVAYKDNETYRKCLRQVVNMDISNLNIPWDQMDDDLDEETKDELLFDNYAMSSTMDYVYDKTKENKFFKEIYLLGASKMFSTDPNIGLAILFSYDFFDLFHLCLQDFFNNKLDTINYNNLKNKIS